MERPFVVENARERQRLVRVVESLTEKELFTPLFANLTVSVALGHLAFWDQWSLSLLRRWKVEKVSAVTVDTDLLNDTLVPILLQIPPRQAGALAIASAEEIDRELEDAPDDLIQAILDLGVPRRLYRSAHRKIHLDEIETRLKSGR